MKKESGRYMAKACINARVKSVKRKITLQQLIEGAVKKEGVNRG